MKLCPQCNNEFDDTRGRCPYDDSPLRPRTAPRGVTVGAGVGATTGGMLGGAPLSATAAAQSVASPAILSAARGAPLSARSGAVLRGVGDSSSTLKPVLGPRIPRPAPSPPSRETDAFATVRDSGYGGEGAPTLANAALDPDALDAPGPDPTTAIASPPASDAGATMRVPPMVQLGLRTTPGVAPAYRPPPRFDPAPPQAQHADAHGLTPSEPADALGTDPSVPMPADERTSVQNTVNPTSPSSPGVDPDAFTDSPTIAIKTVGDIPEYQGPKTEPPTPEDDPPPESGSSEPDLTGQLIAGRYRAIRLLGEGGMGVVYSAVDERLEKHVAIKVLKEEYARRADVVARFTQEAKSAAKIKHENVLQVTDHGKSAEGQHYITMELLTGTDLADVLHRDGTVTVDRGLDLAGQICRALTAAHEQGVVHRDLKPENVFLIQESSGREVVKIVDFGIAQLKDNTGDGKKLTRTGMIFGTPEYMSPEQASGKPIDHRVDVYAVGVILYEMFAGRVPFVGDTFMGVLTQHMFEKPPPLAHINPSVAVSPDLEAVIFKALAKDPGQRYASMAALADDLARVRAGLQAQAPRIQHGAAAAGAFSTPVGSTDPTRPVAVVTSYTGETTLAEAPAPRRRKLGLVLALAVSAAAGLAVAYSLSTPDAPPRVSSPETTPTPATAPTPPRPAAPAANPAPNPAPAANPAPAPVPGAERPGPVTAVRPAEPARVEVRFAVAGHPDARLEARPEGAAEPDPALSCPALPCTRSVTVGVPLQVTAIAGRRRRTSTVVPERAGQEFALDPGPEPRTRPPSGAQGSRPHRQSTPRCGQRYPNSDLLVPCI